MGILVKVCYFRNKLGVDGFQTEDWPYCQAPRHSFHAAKPVFV